VEGCSVQSSGGKKRGKVRAGETKNRGEEVIR